MNSNNLRAADYCLLPVLACVWIIYYPALNSGFFLDDYQNLMRLAEVRHNGFAYYVFSGFSSFLGRPLSLFSFAVQYESWPLDARAFKSVNLLIHLSNGALLYCICRYLAGQLRFTRNESAIITYGVVILWLLHPIQLSATLYVIQRMTLLSTFFTLGGILFYLYFRPAPGDALRLSTGITTGLVIWIFLLLAMLGKENGILLPLYLLIIEATILRQESYTRAWKLWAWIFLGLPLVFLCLYLGVTLDDILGSYRYRTYTVTERLLTEAVVVSDYIYRILIPHPAAYSLYHDDYPVSHGVFHPPVTFWAIVFLCMSLAAAVRWRRRWPVLSFGIFWFLGGHLLESTFLNLELYFEHRNYLPSFGLFFILYWALLMAARTVKTSMIIFFLLAYLLAVVATTLLETRLWANPLLQAIEWARIHPESPRALENLGSRYISALDIAAAINTYEQIAARFPDQIYPAVKILALRSCALDEIAPTEAWDQLLRKAARAGPDRFNLIMEIYNIVISSNADDCPGLDTKRLQDLILVLASNPNFRKDKSYYYDHASLLSLYEGDIYNAIYFVQQSVYASPNMTRLLYQAELLIASGNLSQAKDTIALLEKRMKNYRNKLAYHGRLTELMNGLKMLERKFSGDGAPSGARDETQQDGK